MAQQRMLMRHMHMGIIMDIIMIAFCFIVRSPFLIDPPEVVMQKGYHILRKLVNPF